MEILPDIIGLKKKLLIICCISITLSRIDYSFAQQRVHRNKLTDNEVHKHVFELKTGREIFLFTLGAGLNIYNAYLQNQITPLTSDEIAQLDPEQVNPFDRKTIDNYRAEGTGNYMLYASILIPLAVPLTIFKGD